MSLGYIAVSTSPDPADLQVHHPGGPETILSCGTQVWKGLADRDKVLDAGKFSARALVHNLRDQDYGKTLSDIRAAFYSAPRLPLLYDGDRDLQQAIYDASIQGLMRIVDGSGSEVAVTAPGQVNLSSAGLRLAKTQPTTCQVCGQSAHEGACLAGGGGAAGGNASQGRTGSGHDQLSGADGTGPGGANPQGAGAAIPVKERQAALVTSGFRCKWWARFPVDDQVMRWL